MLTEYNKQNKDTHINNIKMKTHKSSLTEIQWKAVLE